MQQEKNCIARIVICLTGTMFILMNELHYSFS